MKVAIWVKHRKYPLAPLAVHLPNAGEDAPAFFNRIITIENSQGRPVKELDDLTFGFMKPPGDMIGSPALINNNRLIR